MHRSGGLGRRMEPGLRKGERRRREGSHSEGVVCCESSSLLGSSYRES